MSSPERSAHFTHNQLCLHSSLQGPREMPRPILRDLYGCKSGQYLRGLTQPHPHLLELIRDVQLVWVKQQEDEVTPGGGKSGQGRAGRGRCEKARLNQ
jgi:hypothetical protein